MKAAASAQLRLLDLQAGDTAIAQLDHRRRSLPEHAAIAEAKAVRAKLGEALVAVRTRVSDLRLDVAKAESDLVPVRERRERDQRRVDDGVVSDTKALNAMLEEIEHLGRRIGELEDAELEAMEELENATAAEQQAEDDLREVENSLRALVASRDELVAGFDTQIADRRRERDGIAADLPADLVALYDRIRVKSGGLGAAALRGHRCSGCQLEFTPSALAGYLAADADEVLRCEECERIVVRGAGASA